MRFHQSLLVALLGIGHINVCDIPQKTPPLEIQRLRA